MSWTVTVKVAPAYSTQRVLDPAWAATRDVYGDLRFQPGKHSVPLLVNHDDERPLGVVRALNRWDWHDGFWWFASATLDTDPPPWLKRGAGASLSFKALHTNEIVIRGELLATHVTDAFVEEVSVLTPDLAPAEPLAEVLSVRRSGQVVYGGQRLVRPNAGQVLAVR